jgi:hypothetical protein
MSKRESVAATELNSWQWASRSDDMDRAVTGRTYPYHSSDVRAKANLEAALDPEGRRVSAADEGVGGRLVTGT